jgi:ankyrin repeat protein
MTLRKAIRDFFNEVRKPSPAQKLRKLQDLTGRQKLSRQERNQVLELIKGVEDLNGKIYGKKGEELPLLIWAAQNNYTDIAKVLLVRGADVDVEGPDGETPLMCAVAGGRLGMTNMLIRNGAKVDNSDGGGTPLVRAIQCALYNQDYPVNDMLLLLIHAGAGIEAKDCDGNTPLMNAVRNGWTTTVLLLIDKGASINPPDHCTALMLAAGLGHKDIVRLLVDKGADMNWQDKKGSSALSWAINAGHGEIVKFLYEKGANFDAAVEGAKKAGWADAAVTSLASFKQWLEANKAPAADTAADTAVGPSPAPAQVKPPVPK